MNQSALRVLEKRYLMKDRNGKVVESVDGLFHRVADSISDGESVRTRKNWREKFYEMMIHLRFLPNSPTLMNAGKKDGQLSACFVLPVEDSLDSIFDTLKYAAKIHQSGGGTGFSFSRIRPKGSLVRSTSGVASGPVSFIQIFDAATETIKQGGTRRGANMAVLRVDHPDVLEFINSKRSQKRIENFNISVGITDEFMRRVYSHSKFDLVDPRKHAVVQTVDANELFRGICEAAWESGDPGIVFLDRINLLNPTPHVGEMESTNPCGEQPLLPFESCNLGSLNLSTYLKDGKFDWKLFRQDIWTSVRFLDNVIDLNAYPISECKKITTRNRKIGLGVMGYADLLMFMGIKYGTNEAIQFAERLMSFLDREAKLASIQLAEERGAFPNWQGSLWQKLGFPKMRNATVSTIAPTGTISLIAGASSGIEPLFAGITARNVLDGERLVDVHPAVETLMKQRGYRAEELNEKLIARELAQVWAPSHAVNPKDHVRTQAAFQRHCDSAVSKTINLPNSASVESVEGAYRLAYEMGCKGITVYRDKSKASQVLESEDEVPCEDNEVCPTC